MDYIDTFIDEEFEPVPEYAFTLLDVIERFRERDMDCPPRSTIRSRLHNLVDQKKLIYVRVRNNLSYYIPAVYAKNAQLDEQAIMQHGD